MFKKPDVSIEDVIALDGRYPPAAVQFVREGLNHTVGRVYPKGGSPGGRRHVSGQQLCQGLRELALGRWGYLARSVLKHWNITRTRDFGEIVFLLVNSGWMHKEPTDCLEDFDEAYDFADAFGRQFTLRIEADPEPDQS
jgi:uncharacterized repeat protein (TIGR04138 family)